MSVYNGKMNWKLVSGHSLAYAAVLGLVGLSVLGLLIKSLVSLTRSIDSLGVGEEEASSVLMLNVDDWELVAEKLNISLSGESL